MYIKLTSYSKDNSVDYSYATKFTLCDNNTYYQITTQSGRLEFYKVSEYMVEITED